MKKLIVDLENCYGIEKFSYEFDFSKRNRFVIYAANGTMKTSFANTFEKLSDGLKPEERIHGKTPKYRVKDESGADLKEDEIFVITPIDTAFKSERMSRLLVNKKLKVEYDKIRTVLEEKKAALIAELKTLSGLPANAVAPTLARDIAFNENDFYGAIERLRPNVVAKKRSKLGRLLYQTIFEDRVVKMIEATDFQSKLSEYMKNYEELISGSRFFQMGIFNHDNAEEIADNLAENGFFDARHSINMMSKTGKQDPPIETKEKLVKVIADEKAKILSDPKLLKSFDAVNDKLNKNEATRSFRGLLETNPAVIPELKNLPQLRDKLWTDYLVETFEVFQAFTRVYDETKETIQDIFRKAREEETEWRKVLKVFRLRFDVPFDVTIENQVDAMLHEKAPSLAFTHTGKSVKENDLWTYLSMGERRALYLLHIIFEVMGRKELKQKTLYVIDDIADSFDYKNKYAIVEYLYEMTKNPNFFLLIFTHNYDFYRTLVGRFDVGENRVFVEKSKSGVQFVPDTYFRSPFKQWKEKLSENDEMLVATIPFVRNLADYCGHEDRYFDELTKFLHFKPETDSKTIGDLEKLFKDILKDTVSLKEPNRKIKTLLYDLADKISKDTNEVIALEKKIVLSIAIRMRAEEFMVGKINDEYWKTISRNQTMRLIDKFKEKFSGKSAEENNLAVLEDVNLMTPENIHVNSFMYEPILDMSAWHLKELYMRVCALK